jgi:hypothetical protein
LGEKNIDVLSSGLNKWKEKTSMCYPQAEVNGGKTFMSYLHTSVNGKKKHLCVVFRLK